MNRLHIIWDLDGTLINSEKEVLDALILSARAAGLSEQMQKSSFRVGPLVDKILEEAFPEELLTDEKKKEVVSNFRSSYDNCGFNRTLPFSGIEDILSDSSFVHHIVTNKPDLATGRILEKLGWKKYFASVVTPYSFIKNNSDTRKTKSELFAETVASCTGERFVGIGDMDTDCKAAHDNDIPAIGVLWGTGTRVELESAECEFIAENVNQLHLFLISEK